MRSISRSLVWSLLFFLLCVTSTLAATITGTVTNASSSPDARVYVQAQREGWGEANLGVSVPLTSGTASFTIHGLEDGNYVFRAFMDVTGTGVPHLTDPMGESQTVPVSDGVVVGEIVLTTPGAQTALTVDATSVAVSPGDGLVFLHWESPRTEMDLLGADHYRVEWSNDGFANILGSTTPFVAEGDTALFINGLSDDDYQFQIVSLAGDNTATSDPLSVTVGAPTSGVNIFGTVSWSGLAPAEGAPLYLVAVNEEMNSLAVTKIAAPTSGVTYTIPGVLPGTYQIYAVIDQNNNGLLDNGDFENGDLLAPVVTVNDVNLENVDVTIEATPAEFMVSTGHYLSSYGGGDSYSLNLRVNGRNKQVVNVTVSGPQIQTSDLAARSWDEFSLWQNVASRPNVDPAADVYSFTVEYADGSSEVNVPKSVTAVLDNPPTPLTPANDATNAPATDFNFTWQTPSSPAAANYSVRLNSTDGQYWWENWDVPGGETTSTVFTGGLLPDGSYTWSVNLRDALGNEVGYQPGNFFTVGTGGGSGDMDGDGIPDGFDNCPVNYNPLQENTFGDPRGDACEPPPTGDVDSDFDGILNDFDNCPYTPNPDQVNTDGDFYGDVCDPTPNGGGDPGVTGTRTITGTVSNSGQSGRVYLRVSPWGNNDSGYGTSVWVDGSTGAPVDFTIRGVPADQYATYYLSAFMDTTNSGIRSASNPALQSSFSSSELSSGLALTLAAPTLPAPPQLGNQMFFLPGANGTGLIFFDRPEADNKVMAADSYNLYLGTSPDLTTTTNVEQSIIGIKNNEFDATLLKNLTPGATYYAIATTVVNDVESAASSLFSLVAAVPAGGQTVSGTINFTGLDTASLGGGKPAYVILHNSLQEADSRIAMVTVTAASTSFSITDVPNGTYDLYVILDTNDNQYVDLGDIVTTDAEALAVLVDNAPNPVGSVTISAGPVVATAQVEHLDAAASWNQGQAMYCLDLGVEEKTRRPVNVALTSADAGMTDPIDLALSNWSEFEHFICAPTAPALGDTYSFAVTYDDATTVTYDASVTAVLDSFATAVSPSGTAANATMPTFTWNPPQYPPAPFEYSVELQRQVNDQYGTHFEYLWEAWSIPSTQTSVAYDGDPLTPGTYQWRLTVRDQNENEVITAATFTVTDGSGPVDSDGDGVADEFDNCPAVNNPYQENNYGDLRGDACEPPPTGDVDNDFDGVLDDVDNCPANYNPNQENTYGDLRGDACEPPPTGDSDFDGIPDGFDNCPLDVNPQQEDFDYNGIGDVCDSDQDGDSILNVIDNCPNLPNADQADNDGDLIGNVCDATPDGDGGPGGTGTMTVNGTVSFSAPGRVYIRVSPWGNNGDGYGTSVVITTPDTPVSFEIRGVPQIQGSQYYVTAFMDSTGTATQHAGDPVTTTQFPYDQSTNVSLTLQPQSAPTPIPPQIENILPGAGGTALVFLQRPENQDELPLAESYNLYLSTSNTVSTTSFTQKITGIKNNADSDEMIMVSGLTEGSLYAVSTSVVNGEESAASPLFSLPSVVPSGGYSVSGTIDFAGVNEADLSGGKPAYLVLYNEMQPETSRLVMASTTTASMPFTIANVPNGNYQLHAILDMNNNHFFDLGDISSSDKEAIFVEVSGARDLGIVTVAAAAVEALAQTEHMDSSASWDQQNDMYCLRLGIEAGSKLPVQVALTGGPGITEPIDIALSKWGGFNYQQCGPTAPAVPGTYTYAATYADGTTATYEATASAVLDSFATPLTPVTEANTLMPTFSWEAPLNPPTPYSYSLELRHQVTDQYGTHDEYVWEKWSLPAGITSVVYDGAALTEGGTYTWRLTVRDQDENRAVTAATFVPTYDALDTVAPTGSIIINNGAAYTTSPTVILTFTATDAISAADQIEMMVSDNSNFTGSQWMPLISDMEVEVPAATTDGVKTAYVKYRDLAGNISTYSDTIILDTTAPPAPVVSGTAMTNDSTPTWNWVGAGGGSGDFRFAFDSEFVDFIETSNTSFTVPEPEPLPEGTFTLYVQERDGAGNWSAAGSFTTEINAGMPVGSVEILGADPDNLYTKASTVTLALSVDKPNCKVRYKTSDTGAWSAWTATPIDNMLINVGVDLPTTSGLKTIFVEYQDEYGNSSETVSDTITLDAIPPSATVRIVNELLEDLSATNGLELALELAATDEQSGAVSYMIGSKNLNASTCTFSGDWVDYPYDPSTPPMVTLASGDGLRYVCAKVKDLVGNESLIATDSVSLDHTPPTGTVTINGGAPITNNEAVTLTLTGSGAPIGMRFSEDGINWPETWEVFASSAPLTFSAPAEGTLTVYAELQDAAGNTSTTTISDTIAFDLTPPDGMIILKGTTLTADTENIFTRSLDVKVDLTAVSDTFTTNKTLLKVRTHSDAVNAAYPAIWTTWPSNGLLPVMLLSGDGEKAVYVEVMDQAGNTMEFIDTIFLDTSKPGGSFAIVNAEGSELTMTNSLLLNLNLVSDEAVAYLVKTANVTPTTSDSWTPYDFIGEFNLPLATLDGLKTLYVWFLDAAGNISPAVTGTVTLDRTPPTGTVRINSGAVSTNNPTVTLTLTQLGGAVEMEISSTIDGFTGAWETFASPYEWTFDFGEGERSVYVKLRDLAGNVSTVSIVDAIFLDTIAPAGEITIKGTGPLDADPATAENLFTKSALVKVDLSGIEETSTPLQRKLHYKVSETAPWPATWLAWPSTNLLSVTLPAGDGEKTVFVQISDATGNIADFTATITLDSKAPVNQSIVINDGATATNLGTVSLALSAEDLAATNLGAIPSGLVDMMLSTSATFPGAVWQPFTDAVDPFTILATPLVTPGVTKYVYVKYRDAAGNISTARYDTIKYDTVAPAGTIKINAGAIATESASVTLSLTGTGIPVAMDFSNDGTNWDDLWPTFAATYPGHQIDDLAEGEKNVYVRFRDAAGNISTALIKDTIIYDTTPPAGTVLINKGAEFTRSTTVKLDLTKEDVTAVKVSYSVNNGATWSLPVAYPATNQLTVILPAGQGEKTVRVRYSDAVVGRAAEELTPATIFLDSVVPTVPLGTMVNNNLPVDYSDTASGGVLALPLTVPAPSDAGSGIASISWNVANTATGWTDLNSTTGGTFTIDYLLATAPTTTVTKYVYVKVTDNAGNVKVVSDTFSLKP